MTYWKILFGVPMLFISLPGYASPTSDILIEQGTTLVPLGNEDLSKYRGGFRIKDNYIINIGLSITSSINGAQVFHSKIANLIIRNGVLKKQLPDRKQPAHLVNVIQAGQGNIVDNEYASNTDSSLVDNEYGMDVIPPHRSPDNSQAWSENYDISQVLDAPVMPIDSTGFGSQSITNLIQNSLDNSVIGISTIVNIDTQLGNVIKQLQINRKLENAINSRLY